MRGDAQHPLCEAGGGGGESTAISLEQKADCRGGGEPRKPLSLSRQKVKKKKAMPGVWEFPAHRLSLAFQCVSGHKIKMPDFQGQAGRLRICAPFLLGFRILRNTRKEASCCMRSCSSLALIAGSLFASTSLLFIFLESTFIAPSLQILTAPTGQIFKSCLM